MEDVLITNFWKRGQPNISNPASNWKDELELLYKSSISLEVAIAYLYNDKPSLEQFTGWFYKNRVVVEKATENVEDVFSEADFDFWNTNGYVVLKNAISKSDCESTRNAIWEFLNKSLDDEASWYLQHPEQKGLMVNFSSHSTLNKNRMSAKIQKAYEELYQTDKIYKTIDKVSFNPPVSDNYTFMGSGLHWDVSLKLPIPFRLQGLVYLSDCGEKDGAFHCIPGFHNQIENWIAHLPHYANPRETALQTLKPVPIIGAAGDMIIWNQALPHCATPNRGKSPRMVQYLTYFPEDYQEAREWI